MAKRELSSTLKNLKFMQRAVRREEKPKLEEEEEEEAKPDLNTASESTQIKKCIVIMEGNPHPGAIRGRMSFQSFNPSIDKMNEEAANPDRLKFSATSNGDMETSERENGSSSLGAEGSNLSPGSGSDSDHKRKQPEDVMETPYPNKSARNMNGLGEKQSSNNKNSSRKHQKREKRGKLDWSVLRPPKVQSREG